jgi:hypothetical protein
MHLLAPLVGSPLYAEHKGSLLFDGHSSDISIFLLADDEIETVKRYPEVFPSFYFIPTPHLDRAFTKAVSASVYTCAALLLALRRSGVDLHAAFEDWVAWQVRNIEPSAIQQDYYLYRFREDFLRYLEEQIVPALAGQAPQLATLVEYYDLQYRIESGDVEEQCVFRRFDFDVDELHRMVRTNEASWEGVECQPSGMLFVNLGGEPRSGLMYLEVPVHSRSVEAGDVLEIPGMRDQLRTQEKLIIVNKTQGRLLLVDHHMTPETLEYIGLKGTAI